MFISENLENEGKGKKRNWFCYAGITVFPIFMLCDQSQPLWTLGGAGGEGRRSCSCTCDLARARLQLPVWSRSAPQFSHSPGTACYSDAPLLLRVWNSQIGKESMQVLWRFGIGIGYWCCCQKKPFGQAQDQQDGKVSSAYSWRGGVWIHAHR